MRKFIFVFCTICSLLLIGVWQLNRLAADTSLSQWEKGEPGYRSALMEQTQNKKPLLLFFHTDWCQSCKALEMNVLGQDRIIKYLSKFNPVQINPEENQANHDLADQFSVDGYPTLLLIHNGRQAAIRLPIGGKSTIDKFIATCESALRKENT